MWSQSQTTTLSLPRTASSWPPGACFPKRLTVAEPRFSTNSGSWGFNFHVSGNDAESSLQFGSAEALKLHVCACMCSVFPLHSWSLSICSLRQECEVKQFHLGASLRKWGDRELRRRRDGVGEADPRGPSGTGSWSAVYPQPAAGHQSLRCQHEVPGCSLSISPLSQFSPTLPSRPMGLSYTCPCPSHRSHLGSLCSLHGSHIWLLWTHTYLRRPTQEGGALHLLLPLVCPGTLRLSV